MTTDTAIVAMDDPPRAQAIAEALAIGGLPARPATNQRELAALAMSESPSVVLLGPLPTLDCTLALIRAHRLEREDLGPYPAAIGVIVVGNGDAPSTELESLLAGADDYVHEDAGTVLVARARAVARRAHHASGDRGEVRVGSLRIDTRRREVRYRDRRVDLTSRQFELLRALASDPDRLWTKATLLHDVWGFQLPEQARTRTVDSHVSRVRRALRDAGAPDLILCCRGVGYRLLGS